MSINVQLWQLGQLVSGRKVGLVYVLRPVDGRLDQSSPLHQVADVLQDVGVHVKAVGLGQPVNTVAAEVLPNDGF